MILNVCDASSREARTHLEVTSRLLAELGCGDRPVIPVMNKCDLCPGLSGVPMIGGAVRISAKTGEGIPQLLQAVEDALPEKAELVTALLPFSQAGIAAQVRREGMVEQEGGYYSTRKVGNYVYLLSQFYPVYREDAEEAQPRLYVPSVNNELLDSSDVLYPAVPQMENGQLVISSVNLEKPDKIQESKSLIGASGRCYVSKESIYIFGEDYRVRRCGPESCGSPIKTVRYRQGQQAK